MTAYVCYECVRIAYGKVETTPCRIDISNDEIPCRCVISPDIAAARWVPVVTSDPSEDPFADGSSLGWCED